MKNPDYDDLRDVVEIAELDYEPEVNKKLKEGWWLLKIVSRKNNEGDEFAWYILGRPKRFKSQFQ